MASVKYVCEADAGFVLTYDT